MNNDIDKIPYFLIGYILSFGNQGAKRSEEIN